MRAQGFEKVYPMAGGVNAWQNAGLPLTSKA
jgi:rhodanese-related sulfurtransferase